MTQTYVVCVGFCAGILYITYTYACCATHNVGMSQIFIKKKRKKIRKEEGKYKKFLAERVICC